MLGNHIFTMRASLINSFTIPVGPNCGISDFLSVPYTISIKTFCIKTISSCNVLLVVHLQNLSDLRKTKFQ